jgi:hypothetical protein
MVLWTMKISTNEDDEKLKKMIEELEDYLRTNKHDFLPINGIYYICENPEKLYDEKLSDMLRSICEHLSKDNCECKRYYEEPINWK